jgi:hypothetical protein
MASSSADELAAILAAHARWLDAGLLPLGDVNPTYAAVAGTQEDVS